jgi:hypothetical protein
VKGALVALMLLISAALAFAAQLPPGNPAADICNQYTPTFIKASIAESNSNTVTLALKMQTVINGKAVYFDSATPPADPASKPLPLGPAQAPDNFYVYSGLKTVDVLSTDPSLMTALASGNMGDNNPTGEDSQTALVTIPRPDNSNCFVTIIYWGHVQTTTDLSGNLVVDKTKSYSPTYMTMPVCQGGAPSLAAGVTSTTLCLPLVLLVGLLGAAMYVQGKNPLAAFDFSSPRVTGGRPYVMRKGGAINSFGYLLFNAGSYLGTQNSFKPSGTKADLRAGSPTLSGTPFIGGGGSGKSLGGSAKELGMGAGGTAMGAVGELMGIAAIPKNLTAAFAKPKLNASDFGSQKDLQQAIFAGKQQLASFLPGGPMLTILLNMQSKKGGQEGGAGGSGGGGGARGSSENAKEREELVRGMNNAKTDAERQQLAAKINQLDNQQYIGTQINIAKDSGVYLEKINGNYTQLMADMNKPGANTQALVEQYNGDTRGWRNQLTKLGYSQESFVMPKDTTQEQRLMVGNIIANAMAVERKIAQAPTTMNINEFNMLTSQRQQYKNEILMVQAVVENNEKNPNSKISVEEMQQQLGTMKGEKPVNNPEQLVAYHFGVLATSDSKVSTEVVEKFLAKNGKAGMYYLAAQNAAYAADLNKITVDALATGDNRAATVAEVMLGAVGDRAGVLGLMIGETARHEDNKEASQFVMQQAREILPQTLVASVVAAKSLSNDSQFAYARQFQEALGQQVGALQELVATARGAKTSTNIDTAWQALETAMQNADGSGASVHKFVEQNPALATQLLVYTTLSEQVAQVKMQAKMVAYVNQAGPTEIDNHSPLTVRIDVNNVEVAKRALELGSLSAGDTQKVVMLAKEVFNSGQELGWKEQTYVAMLHESIEPSKPKVTVAQRDQLQTDGSVGLEQMIVARKEYNDVVARIYGTKPAEVAKNLLAYTGELDALNDKIKRSSPRGGIVAA